MAWVWVDDNDPLAQIGHDHEHPIYWGGEPSMSLSEAPNTLDPRDAKDVLWWFAKDCKNKAPISDDLMEYAALGAERFAEGKKPPWPTKGGRQKRVIPIHAQFGAMLATGKGFQKTLAEAARDISQYYPDLDQRTLEAAIKIEIDKIKDSGL